MSMSLSGKNIPLVTDFDGTLILTDSLWEGLFLMLHRKPYLFFLLPLWLLRGKLFLKQKLLPYCLEASNSFPLNEPVLNFLLEAKQQGRPLYLATAALEPIARKMASTTAIFSEVFASSPLCNLKATAKAEFLVQHFGVNGFDYIGDSSADVPVWKAARTAIIFTNSKHVLHQAVAANDNYVHLMTDSGGTVKYFRQIRVHQWAKNLLIFIPLLLSHSFTLEAFFASFLAFLSFSLCASFAYVINDLLDLASDRLDPIKKSRPFASGSIQITQSPLIIAALLFSAIVPSLALPVHFIMILATYCLLTFSYSLYFKRKLILDVVCLSSLYFIRIAAGAAAIGSALSNWLLAFSFFLFLGLALIKRTSELRMQSQRNETQAHGRAYLTEDTNILEIMAVNSAFGCLVILTLYIDSMQANQLYTSPFYLWGGVPLAIYWYGRILVLNHRGQIDVDPVRFVIRDKASWCCTVIGVILICIAM